MNTKSILSTVLLLTGVVNFMSAQDFRKNPPKPGPAPKIQLGSYQTLTLSNGLQVIVVENHKLPKVNYQLFVDAGPQLEKDMAGYVSIAGDLLQKGTKSRTKSQIDNEIDFMGADFGTSPSGFFASCLKKHSDKLLSIASDIVLNPSFPKDEFDKIKKQRISGLASQKDDPNSIARNVGMVLRNGANHPYGEVITETTLNNLTLEKCKEYYSTYFKPNISYLIIVGDITQSEAKTQAEKYFGNWQNGKVDKKEYSIPSIPSKTQVAFVEKVGAVQSVVDINYPVVLKPNDPDIIKANLMNRILGAGGFSARLFQNLREAKGYTYGAYSSLNQDLLVGSFSASASVRNTVTDSSITAFLYELNRIRTEKVTDVELTTVKNVATGSFARSLENPRTIANFALNIARYGLPKDYYETYLEKVSKVSPDDIYNMAQRFIQPDKAYILVVGNKDEVADKLKKFAPDGVVNHYDFYGNRIEQKTTAVDSKMTADMVIEKYIAAIGGKDKLSKIKDMSMKMESEVMGKVMEINMDMKEPNKMAQNISMAGMTIMKMAFDGEKGKRMAQGNIADFTPEETAEMKESSSMFRELKYKETGVKLTLKGIEDVDGVKAYKVDAEKNGKKTIQFFDATTFYKIREVKTQGSGEKTTIVTTDFKDYKEVDGVKIPHESQVQGVMPIPLKMIIKTVKFNTNIADTSFKM